MYWKSIHNFYPFLKGKWKSGRNKVEAISLQSRKGKHRRDSKVNLLYDQPLLQSSIRQLKQFSFKGPMKPPVLMIVKSIPFPLPFTSNWERIEIQTAICSGLRASFSNASLQIPRGKWRPSGEPEVDNLAADAATPPALKEARRQMSQEDPSERQQNEENAIKVDIRLKT